MNTRHHSFGYYQPDTAIVRANKTDWSATVNRLMPVGLNRFVREDEP